MALLNVNFFSEVIGMWMQMDVILPQQIQNQDEVEIGRASCRERV